MFDGAPDKGSPVAIYNDVKQSLYKDANEYCNFCCALVSTVEDISFGASRYVGTDVTWHSILF